MKTLLVIILLAATTAYADTPITTCSSQESKVAELQAKLDKIAAERKAYRAKKKAEAEYAAAHPIQPVVLTKTVVVEKYLTVEKTKIKRHIVSLIGVEQAVDLKAEAIDSHTAKATVKTDLVPGLTYQYQFNNGLTPLIGVSLGIEAKPIIGLGYEF